jgi:GNAT superfamily N-acetyltransferase
MPLPELKRKQGKENLKTASIEYRYSVEPADRDRIRNIVESSGFFNCEEIEVAVELAEERLAKGEKSGYFFVFAEMEGRMVGYACFGPISGTQCSFDLYWIAVEDGCRGTGIGKGLLYKAEESIRVMGGRRIYVETSSRELYEPTRAFYRNNGYRLEAALEDFYAPGDSRNTYVRVL